MLPALAARTERIELGTLVSPVTFRPAAVLANASATANEISGGRVSLGMGTGWMEAEHEAFGFPFPPMKERLGLFREQIEAVRGFWGDGPRPHLIVGGSGLSGTVDPAARFADEYNTVMATPEECAERREKLARACEREGREPIPLSLMTGCAIGRDDARGARAHPPPPGARRPADRSGRVQGAARAPPRSSARSRRPPSACGPTSRRASSA